MTRGFAISLFLSVATLALAGLAAADYFNLATVPNLPVRRLAVSLAAVWLTWLISRAIDRLVTGINAGRHRWQRRLRRALHVENDERVREVEVFGGLLHFALWLGLPLLILRIWGLSRTSLEVLKHLAWTGFPVGQVQIVPAQLLIGAALLVVLAIVIRWLTGRMENQWLARTPMEAHTREAVATISGYVLFVVATLVVLSYAGLDLTKLALIAGALSVGIGFGLQNIVNNFVSGIILLFEQPIRRGNYISVGDTEGFVRRIRIRATEMETLERMSVIVPNSELLNLHVKNWNLRDRYGRVSCPVGVAYGSDVRLVERLLLDVAEAHPEVLSTPPKNVPRPAALFRGFGDSALDFELRCVIRDITRRFFVISDLNFAIDAAFREHGVTIAFPQLDVWHRNTPANET